MFSFLKKIYWLLNRPTKYQFQYMEQLRRDREELLYSSLWDDNYYISNYHELCSQTKLSPLDHYLQVGWKLGCNPSAHFLNDEFMMLYEIDTNPLLYFLKQLRLSGFRGVLTNTWLLSPKKLAAYLEKKSQRQSKKVVYTCMTKGYNLLNHYYVDDEWDYVCFTDDEDKIRQGMVGHWEIRPLVTTEKLDPTRINRFHKILPHIVLPEYEESIYVDAKVNVLSDYLFETVALYDQDFIGSKHMCTNSVFKEAEYCIRCDFDVDLLKKQLDFYRQEGLPSEQVFRENCVIYRRHKKPEIIDLMEQWWYWVKNYCRRDQISLPYVMWKNKADEKNPPVLNNPFSDYEHFAIITSRKIQFKRYGHVIPETREEWLKQKNAHTNN